MKVCRLVRVVFQVLQFLGLAEFELMLKVVLYLFLRRGRVLDRKEDRPLWQSSLFALMSDLQSNFDLIVLHLDERTKLARETRG
jgi:hypothetical protein